MRKLIALVFTLGTLVGVSVGATPALAANSTCADHSISQGALFFGGGTQTMQFSEHFQCGGANNEAFALKNFLQYQSTTGVWHQAICEVQLNCIVFKPTSGWFAGGSDHNGLVVAYDIDVSENGACPNNAQYHQNWRNKVTVQFQDSSPDINYFGPSNSFNC